MMKKMILKAVNEMYSESFETFEEIFDVYTIQEAIEAYLKYNGFGNCFLELWDLFSTFYDMFEKRI